MGLIQCKAFTQHGCMIKQTKQPLICCHSCRGYEQCLKRCENKPRSCGMGTVTDKELYSPFENNPLYREKRVAKYDADTGKLIAVFTSVNAAADSIRDGSSHASRATCISRSARGVQKTAKGYVWRYI